MRINRMVFTALRNDEHYQLNAEVRALIAAHNPDLLGVADDFARYQSLCDDEFVALHPIRKSALSGPLSEADLQRGRVFRGLADAVKSALNHFDPRKKEAAHRLSILLGHCGNVARKPYNEATATIVKLVNELSGTHVADLDALGLTDWARELAARNNEFVALTQGRFTQESERTPLRMKQVRNQVDAQLRKMLSRIDALVIVNGPSAYETVVRELNARIDNYRQAVAIRQGKAATGKQIEG